MKRIFSHLRPFLPQVLLSSLLMAAASLGQLLLPALMSQVVDDGIYQKDFSVILRCCVLMLAISLVSMAASAGGGKLSADTVSGFTASLRTGIFRKVMGMGHASFGHLDTGALVTRSTQDVETVSWAASTLSSSIISIPAMFLGGVILSFQVDPVLASVILCAVPLVFVIVIFIGRKVFPLWEQSDAYIDRQNELMRQRLRGIRVIRAFRREPVEHEKIADATHVMADNIIRSNVAMQSLNPIASFFLNGAALVILYLAAVRMQSGASAATGGDVLALVQYITFITTGVLTASFAIVMIPHTLVACRRILQVLDLPDDGAEQGEQVRLEGGIRLEDLTFSFETDSEPAVRDISLDISPGQRVAIIGSTGSGKSALIHLLLGFQQAQKGRILFDGRDSRALAASCIRRQISCVLQKTAIYTGTIRENVAMGRPDATDEEIWRALDIAQLRRYVESLPQGLDHRLELSGSNLSGGQRQRLAIARAVIKDAPIYIFDDSFSALDFLTESRLRARLRQELGDRTQIVVTQRVTTARGADHIFVMDQGRLVDHGKHEDLLTRCQVYREIYLSQTGGEGQ